MPNTVSASLDVPVAGAGVIGFSPSIVASITVDDVSVKPGMTGQAHATAVMIDGRKIDVTKQAAWTSSATAKATVDNTGLVTGVAAGSAELTAALFGVSGQGTVSVA